MWLQQVVQPSGPGSFFKRDIHVALQPLDKLQNGDRLRFDDGFHDQLASRIHHRDRDRVFVNVQPNIFFTSHCRSPFLLRPTLKIYNVAVVLRQNSIARCHGSPTQAHCSSTVAAWCETDQASASAQPIESPEADQYQESGVATSLRCASVLRTAVLSWLVCARTAARRVVRSKVPLAGARWLR